MPAARHTSAEFQRFLDRLVDRYPRTQEIHVILDNLSAHKTTAVQAWFAAHPHVHSHFTPTYSSWLNQVEHWFAKVERDVIARGIFTSTGDLARKLRRYITLHNKTCQPIAWTYDNPKTAFVPSRIETHSTSGEISPVAERAPAVPLALATGQRLN